MSLPYCGLLAGGAGYIIKTPDSLARKKRTLCLRFQIGKLQRMHRTGLDRLRGTWGNSRGYPCGRYMPRSLNAKDTEIQERPPTGSLTHGMIISAFFPTRVC